MSRAATARASAFKFHPPTGTAPDHVPSLSHSGKLHAEKKAWPSTCTAVPSVNRSDKFLLFAMESPPQKDPDGRPSQASTARASSCTKRKRAHLVLNVSRSSKLLDTTPSNLRAPKDHPERQPLGQAPRYIVPSDSRSGKLPACRVATSVPSVSRSDKLLLTYWRTEIPRSPNVSRSRCSMTSQSRTSTARANSSGVSKARCP